MAKGRCDATTGAHTLRVPVADLWGGIGTSQPAASLIESNVVPTVLRWKGWIFLFYSADWREPPHVHARKGRQEVKFWLGDCSVAATRRVARQELNALQEEVRRHRQEFLERWHEHFGR